MPKSEPILTFSATHSSRWHTWVMGVGVVVLTGATMVAAAPAKHSNIRLDDLPVKAAQHDGYTTLTWAPVAGAEDYQIERTLVNASNQPIGDSVISGVWRPNRQVHQEAPSFADAGFRAGLRFRWRVRARIGGLPQPFSEAVFAATNPPSGPAAFHTRFETDSMAPFTSYDEEMDWTKRLLAASKRVRVVTIGHTVQGRAINLFIIGMPAPLGNAAEISRTPAVGANCIVHGNEPSGREGCFPLIRDLAFSNDAWVTDILTHATVLIIPSLNGDGRALNTRGNATGQDLNRDHGRLTQPETQAFAAFERDYTPDAMLDGHEYGSNTTCDLPLLWSRHSNTAPSVHNLGKVGMVEGWFYDHGATDGWWPCPYPVPGIPGAQTFTRVSGLKNMIVTLVEARSGGGPSRPNETDPANNRRRKAYSQMWSARQLLSYHRANLPAIQKAIADGIAFQQSNTGRIVFHGDWDAPAFPAPHPGDTPPPGGAPGPDNILDPAPCGYLIGKAQYTAKLNDSGNLPDSLKTSVSQRLAAHGIRVEEHADGFFVPLAQPLRGLINIVLDSMTPPAPIIAARRVMACRD